MSKNANQVKIYPLVENFQNEIGIVTDSVRRLLNTPFSEEVTNLAITDVIISSYAKAYNDGKFFYQDDDKQPHFCWALNSDLLNGEKIMVKARINKYNNYPQKYIVPIAWKQEPSSELFEFSTMFNYNTRIRELKNLALPEKWDFQLKESETPEYRILDSYLKYTFYRLKKENKIEYSIDQSKAAFNTGLVDKHYREIFALFSSKNENNKKWKFDGFCIFGVKGLGKILSDYFEVTPQPAQYFSNIQDLYFNPDKELDYDKDHVIIDNIDRLPLELLKNCSFDNENALSICKDIEKISNEEDINRCYNRLRNIINDKNDSKLYHRIMKEIDSAIDLAIKQTRWNYKTALPGYDAKANSTILFLPLCILDETIADAALLVSTSPSGRYKGQTIYPLEWAYKYSRLIVRPSSEWLNPDVIVDSGDNKENNHEKKVKSEGYKNNKVNDNKENNANRDIDKDNNNIKNEGIENRTVNKNQEVHIVNNDNDKNSENIERRKGIANNERQDNNKEREDRVNRKDEGNDGEYKAYNDTMAFEFMYPANVRDAVFYINYLANNCIVSVSASKNDRLELDKQKKEFRLIFEDNSILYIANRKETYGATLRHNCILYYRGVNGSLSHLVLMRFLRKSSPLIICSECGESLDNRYQNFCRNCGSPNN
jgi:hypothetical protein